MGGMCSTNRNLPKENKVIIDGQTYYGGLNQPNIKFIKVKVDCWERIFEFLSLRDILSMSQTCQRMLQIGGYYFRENFHGTECNLFNHSDTRISISSCDIDHEDFLQFIDKFVLKNVSFNNDQMEKLRSLSGMGLLSSLTTLKLQHVNIDEHQIIGLHNLQTNIGNIECVEMVNCYIVDGIFLAEFLSSCPKLKCLKLKDISFRTMEARCSLFQRTYPLLECFEYLDDVFSIEILEWQWLLSHNPGLKRIYMKYKGFDRIVTELPIVIQLDHLNLYVNLKANRHDIDVANRLKTLHSNGCFKTLHLSCFIEPPFINKMVLFDAMETLATRQFDADICRLIGLKELQLRFDSNSNQNLESIAMNLVNLERLWISCAVDCLIPFLRHSKKLKIIALYHNSVQCGNFELNLRKLNVARQISGIKRIVQIGMNEDIYLATKWMAKDVDFDLIEVVRMEKINNQFYVF